jgi:hypothetical protein
MEKRTIIKQATSVGEPPEYTWTVMPDGMIFDTKQEAKDYIYNKRPRWYWKTCDNKAGRKRETAVKQYLAKIKLAQCVNFQRETLDIPKDFIADVSNDKNRTYHTQHGTGRRLGSKSVIIKQENTAGGDIRQARVFADNFKSFSRDYSSGDVGANLMGFVHQIECLQDLRYDSQNTPYFSKVDSRLGSARYEADRSIASEFPKAYEHLDVQCNTYIESEDGTHYVDLLRKSKGLLEDARKNSDLSFNPTFCFDGVKYSWRPEDKVKYSTRAFLKRTCQMTTKSDYRKEWTLQVSPMWNERCAYFGKSYMGNRPLFPMSLTVYKKYDEKKGSYVELDWVKKEGKKLYKGNFVDFAFTKRTEANGYTDKEGMHKGYEFTPNVIPNLFLMAKTLPSGDVLHAVHEDIGKANRDLDKKLVTKIANELEIKS